MLDYRWRVSLPVVTNPCASAEARMHVSPREMSPPRENWVVQAAASDAVRTGRSKKLLKPFDKLLALRLNSFERTSLDRQAEILYIGRVLPGHVSANDG